MSPATSPPSGPPSSQAPGPAAPNAAPNPAAAGPAGPGPGPAPNPPLPAAVQATVAAFDPETGTGAVLLDDGRAVTFGAAAFAASGLRLLRPGQRVRVESRGGPGAAEVTRVTLYTLP